MGYYNAAMALGMKMYRERLTYAELSAGLSLMSQAAQQLAKLTKDPERSRGAAPFEPAKRELISQRVNPVWRIIGSVDPDVVQAHAGDTFVIAPMHPSECGASKRSSRWDDTSSRRSDSATDPTQSARWKQWHRTKRIRS